MTTSLLTSQFVDKWATGFTDPAMFDFATQVGVDMYLQDNLTSSIELLKEARTRGTAENPTDRFIAQLTTELIKYNPEGLGLSKTHGKELASILNLLHSIKLALEWYIDRADESAIIDGTTSKDANEGHLLKTYTYCKNKNQHLDILWHMAIIKLVRKTNFLEYREFLPLLLEFRDIQYKRFQDTLPADAIPDGKITIEHTW